MALERRRHPRHRPFAEVQCRLQEDAGAYKEAALLLDLSEGGCSLRLATPPRGGVLLLLELALKPDLVLLQLQCQMTARCALGDTWQISLAFREISAEVAMQLRTSLASDCFMPAIADAPASLRKHWRVDQWAAFLTAQDLPVMARSKKALLTLEADEAASISARDLADLANGDPFLCLCLLRDAENRRSSRLGHETSTPLAAVMQIGSKGFREQLMSCPVTDENMRGLARCEARASAACRLAGQWSTARSDVLPDELMMAALLGEMGELMLWHFAPELPQAAHDALASGEAHRSAEAQELGCGFKFKDLTLKCVEIWRLPKIIVQLIRGHDDTRANIARVSIDTARHLAAGGDNPALADDLADIKTLVPGASMDWLVSCMSEVAVESRPELIAKAGAALEKRKQQEGRKSIEQRAQKDIDCRNPVH